VDKAVSRPRTRARTRWRWLRSAVVLSLVFAGFPAALSAVAHTRMAREFAGRAATDALQRELGFSAHIGEVHVETSPLAIVANDIRLDHPKHGRFVKASELRIKPTWWVLLTGRVDLHSIRIEHATVWIRLRDGKIENLPDLPKAPASKSQELELPFDWLHLEQARLVIDAAPLASGELRNIEIDLSALHPGGVRAVVTADHGFVEHESGRDNISRIELAATLSEHSLTVERLLVKTPEVQLGLRDAELTLPDATRYHGHVEVGLYVPQVARWPLHVELPHLEGQVELQADLDVDPSGARGTAHVVVERGVVKQFGLGKRVNLDVRFDPKQATFKGAAELIRDGGSVDLDGKLDLGAPGMPLTLRGDVHDVGFAKLMEQLGVSPNAIVDWTLAGSFVLSGPTSPLELSGPLRMPTRDFKILRHAWHAPPPERRIMGIDSAKLTGNVVVRADGIHLQDIDIEMPKSRLNATVLLGFDNQLRVQAQGLDWDLSDCSPLIDLQLGGRGTFSADVAGTFSDPTVKGHIKVAGYTFNAFDFGDVESDFTIDEDLMGVHFPHIDAKKNDSRYALDNGSLDFRQDAFRAAGQLAVEKLSLADFYRVFHYDGDERYDPYQADVSGKVGLDYTLGRPGQSANGTLAVDMDLAVASAQLDTYHFKDGHFTGQWTWLDPAAGYRGGVLSIERLSLHKGQGTLNLSGKMSQGGLLDFVALADKIAVRDAEGLGDRVPGLAGTLALTASIKGTAVDPRADIELTGTGITLGGDPLGDGRAYVRLTDKQDPWIAQALTWTPGAPPADAACGHAREGLARGQWPEDPPLRTREGPSPRLEQPMAWIVCGAALGGQLGVDLAIGRTQSYPMRGQVELHALDFGRVLPRMRGRAPLHGRVSGVVAMNDGEVLVPQTLAGAITLSELRTGQNDVELKNKGPLSLTFDHGAFDVKSAHLVGPSSQLDISGGGSLQNGLSLDFDGSIDLSLLTTLSQTVSEASGSVTLGFKVTGPIEQPTVYGLAQVRNAALKIASFPQAAREVSGNVTFSARRVVLEGFSAKVAGGEVDWSGAAELEGRGIGSYALQIDASGLALRPRDGIDMKLGGHGELSWKHGDDMPVLHGKLRLDEFVYTRPIKINRTLEEMAAPERSESAAYDPALDMLKIDLELEQSKPLFIHNNLIDAEMRLETVKLPFRLVGTDQRLGVIGNMSVRHGTVHFRERAFDVRQGDIHFDDETRIDPNFDLRATTEVRRTTDHTDWHMEIHAFGSRDRFQFELTSDPYLSEDDIALLLTVGMTHAELAQLQTSELTSTAALEALSSVTGVEGELHRALPQIDDFHIASAYSDRTYRTEPQVVIGKRIAQNVRLSAATGIAEARDFRTGVELELNDETSVQAVYNNQNTTTASQLGDVGVDLKWRLEFD
jgi:translocation and assembly module TamB